MTRHFRPVAVGLLALFGAAGLTYTSLAQAPHRAISAAAKVAEARARDLGLHRLNRKAFLPNG